MHPGLILLLAIAIVLGGILGLRLHACLVLLVAALTVALLTPTATLREYADSQVSKNEWTERAAEKFINKSPAQRVADGFGKTCGSIGILIAMAAIIGKCLLDSGAADRIVRSTVRAVGEPKAPVAFVGSSFLLGIPVFFDTVFYLMIPLGKALRLRTGRNYVLYILSIVAGGSMAHSLVPPTPGPLFVADSMGVNLLTMIIGGCMVGMVSSTSAFLFAKWLDRRIDIPLRSSAEMSLEQLEKLANRDESSLPPLWLALLPIVLPVVLIAVQTALSTTVKSYGDATVPAALFRLNQIFLTVGNKNVALMIAAGVALATLAWTQRGKASKLGQAIPQALAGGGVIILITASGGSFGEAVRQSGIADEIGQLTAQVSAIWLIPIAFIITTLIRTAQGSATVAMMTSVSVIQGVIPENLPYHPVFIALAIGCGSKPVAWMADSGFWVICKMSGMTEAEGLKTVTPTSIVMGVSGLIATLVFALLWQLLTPILS